MKSSAENNAVAGALEQVGREPVDSSRNLSGGCIHAVRLLTLTDGSQVVAKLNAGRFRSVFEEEAHGLRALHATQTVLVPQLLVVTESHGIAVLLMTAVEPGRATTGTWQQFGRDLATLHAADVGQRYGFESDNHLGSTPQPNEFYDDWAEFNALHRLGHQRDLIRNAGTMNHSELAAIDRVIDALPNLIPRKPRPALLHGDLWSGNAMPSTGGRIAVIDPACSIGDGWADIAMMQLFGGFPAECFDAYRASVDDHANLEARIGVYQLYHVLNHVTIFGRGYVPQALQLARRLMQLG